MEGIIANGATSVKINVSEDGESVHVAKKMDVSIQQIIGAKLAI